MITSEDILIFSELLKNDTEIENPKIEIKEKWWDLSDDFGKNEFLKDVTAMANTPGETGYIIVGISKNGELQDTSIPIDPSKIRGVICKSVQDPMNVEVYLIPVNGKEISIIEVPASPSKPHIIKQYRSKNQVISMFIPIRKGTSVNAASRYDLDLMYLERNRKIIIDYGLDIKIAEKTYINANPKPHDSSDIAEIGIPATIINKGINVNCIFGGRLIIENQADLKVKYDYRFKCVEIGEIRHYLTSSNFLKINSNDVVRGFFVFGLNEEEWNLFKFRKNIKLKCHLEIIDIMENTFISNSFTLA